MFTQRHKDHKEERHREYFLNFVASWLCEKNSSRYFSEAIGSWRE
jgi:hypothetical protein